MFNKRSSRPSLALFVALALGSGALLAPSAADAADVSSNDVVIDDTHAPSNNVVDAANHIRGTAAGFVKDTADSRNVKDNKLTLRNFTYANQVFGGFTWGTGHVTGNKVFIHPATAPHSSVTNGVYGGATDGGGNAENNHVFFEGTLSNGDLVGGMTTKSTSTQPSENGTGAAKKNKVTLKSGHVQDVYGGLTSNGSDGDAIENEVTIEGGEAGNVYGGHAAGNGNVKGNTVTIKGGIITGAYGGYSDGTGEVTGNTVNLGDGTGAMAAGYAINGTLFGGQNTTDPNKVSNNTLNVNTNAVAHNIKNFSTINFNFNAHTNAASSLLTLSDSAGTQIASLEQIHLSGAPLDKSEGTLIENTHGITLGTYSGAVSRTMEKTESIINRDGTNKIGYKYYQFKDSTETRSDSSAIWGGRSILGNTTTGNEVTVSGSHSARSAYGGWTAGAGSTATGENAQKHSIGNKITLEGAASEVYHMFGGLTNVTGGSATGNRATLTNGRVTGNLAGGQASNGNVSDNAVDINGGRVDGATYGGITGGTGKAEKNTATLAGGTLNSDIYGGVAASGDAVKNTVNIKGGSAASHDVYGGFSTNGNATGNIVNITGGSVRDVKGGRAANGNATDNTINIANTTVSSITGGEGAATNNNTVNLNGGANVTGALKGGSQANGTGNTLNIKGKNNSAGQIAGFQKMVFDATGVTQGDTMLRLTDGTTMNGVDKDMLKANGTSAGKVTLLENNAGINFTTAVAGDVLKSETSDTMEKRIDVERNGSQITKLTYEGYQFKGKHTTTSFTESGVTSTWGGRSKAGNTTTENAITVASGTHTNIYGGWTTGSGSTAAADKQKNSTANKVKVNGSANVTGTVYGGFTSVTAGKAQNNEVTIEKNLTANVVGGEAKGEASGNTVTVKANAADITGGKSTGAASNNTVNLANATVNSITGGDGATTNNNTVNLNGGANVTGALKGGSAANGTGNTLNVKGKDNKASTISGFQKMNFDATGASTNEAMLRTTGATDVNWNMLTVKNASASEKPLTLLENANGINISGRTGDAVKSELNADATMETNIDIRQSGSTITAITYEGYTFKGATQATIYGADTWAGRSKAGNTTQDNKLTLSDASKTYANVYGGWTSGTGTKAAADKQNNSLSNTVDYTAGTVTGTLYGGYAANGEASGNTVNLGAVTTTANIYGGFGAVTKNNTINLKGARVTGTVTGGSQANGMGNTLAVYKPSEVHDFAGIQNLHFYTDEMAAGAATPMLKLGTATKDIRGLNIGVARSGAAPKLSKGDKILLMKTAGGALTTDAAIQNKVEGMQGVSRRYEYEIKQEATGELTATVTKAGFAEQAKSLVETRAGLASFVNQGADYLVQDGLAAAEMSVSASDADKGGKNAQRQGASSDGAAYQLWAGAGANSMRAESGSYVDSKGWNLGVGWAREDVQKDGATVLFSPFVEYGRGTYDSYLDDGTHGSGKISYIGAGILGKLTQKDGLWLEGSLRAGRAKSDYSANLSGTAASYDGSNTYYGAHLGAGKTFAIKEYSSIDAYARYFWSHQNSMTATLNTGDLYEFGSVNSQRLRLGFRYSLKDKTTGEFYAGLAWEHEFAGKAGATYQGDAAPSPSLKGSSTMLELGYRFMPENSRVSYDLHLNGWQGQRKGITGGASIKWAF